MCRIRPTPRPRLTTTTTHTHVHVCVRMQGLSLLPDSVPPPAPQARGELHLSACLESPSVAALNAQRGEALLAGADEVSAPQVWDYVWGWEGGGGSQRAARRGAACKGGRGSAAGVEESVGWGKG
eukprot:259331-Chlamydomonas_euryale.AAC.1